MSTTLPTHLEHRLYEVRDNPAISTTDTERRTQTLQRVDLTVAEQLEYGKLNADANRSIKQLEDDLATVKKQLQAQIEAQKALIEQKSEALRSGYEPRMVECLVVLEYPKRGRRTTFRLDTMEAVEEGLMTESELQRMLKLEDAQKARAAEAAAQDVEPEPPAKDQPAGKLPKVKPAV